MVNSSYSEYSKWGGLNNVDPMAGGSRRAVRAPNRAGATTNLETIRQERSEIQRQRKINTNRNRKRLKANNSKKNIPTPKLSLGMFVYSGQFSPSSQSLKNMSTIIKDKVLENLSKTAKIGSLTYKLIEVVGRDVRFKKLFSVTSEYGLSFNKRQNLPANTVFDYRFRVSDGTNSSTGLITYFLKTGKVLVKGGYLNCTSGNDYLGLSSQPTSLFSSLWKMYGFSTSTLPKIKRVNTVATARMGRKFDEKEFTKNIYGKNKFGNLEIVKIKVDKEGKPKKKDAVTMTRFKFENTNHHVFISRLGVVQIMFKGEVTRQNLKMFFSKIKTFPTKFSKYFKGRAKYNSPKTRIARRRNNQVAPNLTRRGTTCPIAKRPTPYSFAGKCPPGMYCRPNPQQQPCCYTKPKNPRIYRSKVKLAYNTAQARMPNNVANLFGINRNNRNKNVNISKNLPNIKIYATKTTVYKNGNTFEVNNIRIGSRQCLRYTKEKLLDFLERMGHSTARIQNKSKQELCKLIKELAKNTNINNTINKYIPTFKYKGKPTQLTLKSGKILMIGRRECSSFSHSAMLQVCIALKIRVDEDTTRPQMCKLVDEKRRAMLSGKIRNNINKNLNKAAKRTVNAEEKAVENKIAMYDRRDNVLYQMFITRISKFVIRFEKYGSKKTVPTKKRFLENFQFDVNFNNARPVNARLPRGWKKPFMSWLNKYVMKYETRHKQNFINLRKNTIARNKRNNKAARENAKIQIKFTLDEAKKDLIRFRNTKIDKNLRPFFTKKIDSFSKQYMNFVTSHVGKNNSTTKTSRQKAWIMVEKKTGGGIRNYLNKIVNKIPPKYTGNNQRQRYVLNNNLKLVLGPKIKVNRL